MNRGVPKGGKVSSRHRAISNRFPREVTTHNTMDGFSGPDTDGGATWYQLATRLLVAQSISRTSQCLSQTKKGLDTVGQLVLLAIARLLTLCTNIGR